ncbi:hypothetical protein [Halorubrum sp. DM2]|uniref:hypothetical protein n=1 Tax=Halorubrum sp. DM2 TaxID=2527867 RepID=UPI0024B77978|nr:hypothetical protein [Halorubrum sp. DM2]
MSDTTDAGGLRMRVDRAVDDETTDEVSGEERGPTTAIGGGPNGPTDGRSTHVVRRERTAGDPVGDRYEGLRPDRNYHDTNRNNDTVITTININTARVST